MRATLKVSVVAVWLLWSTVGLAKPTTAEEVGKAIGELPWQRGPANLAVGAKSTMVIPDGSGLLREADSGKFLELTGNLPSRGTSILVTNNWWATFSFDESGYIKDDEKIDADALLKTIKETDGPANEERRKRGLPEIYTDGWQIPPRYDFTNKYLEWALRLRANDNQGPVINYTVRILGRTGYERIVLVSSPEQMDADVKAFKEMLRGFKFNPGETYAEFKQGDRVAEFGLAALVVGGAAAVAAKSGLWKVILAFVAASWKLLAGAAVAAAYGIAKLLGRKSK